MRIRAWLKDSGENVYIVGFVSGEETYAVTVCVDGQFGLVDIRELETDKYDPADYDDWISYIN